MPQLDFHWTLSQVIWLSLTFAFLYFMMARITLPNLERVLKKREDTIGGNLALAETARAQAETMEVEYNASMADANAKARELMQTLHKETEAEAFRRHQELEHSLDKKMQAAERSMEQARVDSFESFIPVITDLSILVAEKIGHVKPSHKQAEKVIQSLLKGKNYA